MSPASGPTAGQGQDAQIITGAEQDCRPGPVRLEIAPPVRYARARPYVDRSPEGEPARAKFLDDPDRSTPEDAPPAAAALASDQGENPTARPRRRYPLRPRGRRTRDAKRAAYLHAPDRRARLAVATDYARSVTKTAEQWGMVTDPTPEVAAAIEAATDALMAAGDALTRAMHTWSPGPEHQQHTTGTPRDTPPWATPRRTAAAHTGHPTARAVVHPTPPQSAHHPIDNPSPQRHTTDLTTHHTTRHTTASPPHPGPGEHTSRGGAR